MLRLLLGKQEFEKFGHQGPLNDPKIEPKSQIGPVLIDSNGTRIESIKLTRKSLFCYAQQPNNPLTKPSQ